MSDCGCDSNDCGGGDNINDCGGGDNNDCTKEDNSNDCSRKDNSNDCGRGDNNDNSPGDSLWYNDNYGSSYHKSNIRQLRRKDRKKKPMEDSCCSML